MKLCIFTKSRSYLHVLNLTLDVMNTLKLAFVIIGLKFHAFAYNLDFVWEFKREKRWALGERGVEGRRDFLLVWKS